MVLRDAACHGEDDPGLAGQSRTLPKMAASRRRSGPNFTCRKMHGIPKLFPSTATFKGLLVSLCLFNPSDSLLEYTDALAATNQIGWYRAVQSECDEQCHKVMSSTVQSRPR